MQTQFRGFFHPAYHPRVTGFNKQGGAFWIGFIDDEDISHGVVQIELTVWAEDSPSRSTYASLRIHHDGIRVLRKLKEIGFLDMFEEIGASNFYDVAQCCARCNIPIMYHGEDNKEMTPRKIYEMLYIDRPPKEIHA